MSLTKSQLNHLINVHGLRTPRSKEVKAIDQLNYERGYKKSGTTLKSIYAVVKETII